MANVYTNGNTGYKGVDRRKSSRRTVVDRRKEIRWEPNKSNRREAIGRRAADMLGAKETLNKSRPLTC